MPPVWYNRLNSFNNNYSDSSYTVSNQRTYSHQTFDYSNYEENYNIRGTVSSKNSSSSSRPDLTVNQFVCLFINKKGANKGRICGSTNVLAEGDYKCCRLHLGKK